MYIKYLRSYLTACLTLSHMGSSNANETVNSKQEDIEVIVVQSEFKPLPLMETANSVSVITSSNVMDRSANFLSDMLAATPNLNYSAGASRGKFFQIRGIGELAEFQQVLRPSVGLLIDGIDYSSLGGAATLFDVNRVEILRGPQGTLFGANALAGMINMTTNQATEDFTAEVSARMANIDSNRGMIDTREYGVVINGPLSEQVNGRIAVQSNVSDGYVENNFLERENTNGIDETMVRLKLAIEPADDLAIDLNVLSLDFDNGYDAFTLDNSRNTVSDEPGSDDLKSLGVSIITNYKMSDKTALTAIISTADSDSAYGFDLDWRSPSFCGDFPSIPSDCSFFGTRLFDRDTNTDTMDIRLASASENGDDNHWVFGAYIRNEQQGLTMTDHFFGVPIVFSRQFGAKNTAMYGDLSVPLSDASNIKVGLRSEHYHSDYADSNAVENGNDETLHGGHISIDNQLNKHHFTYVRIAKGYKTGGVNIKNHDEIPLTYDTESLWNYELGIKSILSNQLHTQVALFYQDRKDAQVEQTFADCTGNSACTGFTSYFINAAKANSYGLEAELVYLPVERVKINASLGLMNSEFEEFSSFSHANSLRIARETGAYVETDLSGKALSHAPSYQFAVSANYELTEDINIWVSVDGRDSFELGDNHNETTRAYELFNAKLTWMPSSNLTLALFGKNLTNQDYIVRGFGTWDNDPRQGDGYDGYGPYYQFGNPRELGIELSYQF